MTRTIAALIVCCWASAAAAGQARGADAVARVGDRTVTVDELRDVIIDQRRTGEMPKVVEALTPEGQRRILQQMIDTHLLAFGARDARLDRDPAVQRAIARAVDLVLADQLARREAAALDDRALRDYYDSHEAQFRIGERVHVRHIVVASEAEARQARDLLDAGGDFAALAAERNVDASRRASGDLGWVKRGVMVRAFEDAAFALTAGETSAIVKTSFGFHLLRAEAIDPGTLPPLDAVREQVRERALAERMAALKRLLAATHTVTVDETALKGAGR
ncbi:MAG: peptidylprolyl cis-trans isomerase lipoprotein PpiC-type [Acidobacteria bacterium]|nr:peptidylprolyl cis-trans isomerase lipoprotein PpiC-type [Acidobacteriota bacterium]